MAMSKGLAVAVGAWAVGFSSVAWALPVLDAKDAEVCIATDATTMNITSKVKNNVIRWVDFSVAGGVDREKVAFDGNNYLNYVTGHARSEILGTLTGGGDIYIVNPNGILIGDGATVDVGKLYLSTRELEDVRFDAFTAHGTSPIQYGGDVVNLGKLNATEISVEGNVIKFKNVADVQADTVNVSSVSELHIGYEAGTEETVVNETEYADFSPPSPSNWNLVGNETKWYMLVRNAHELQNMRNNLNGNYMLAGNIKGENFTSIGYSRTGMQYQGRFDGMGYGISLRCIDANQYASGLFGAIGSKSVVENVSVKTTEIATPVQTRDGVCYIGSVVGHNNHGTVKNVSFTGNINSTAVGTKYIGGIVGYNDGGKAEFVHNNGDISASGGNDVRVGGIVGYNYDGGTIQYAYNTGAVESEMYAGGIAGYNRDGIITNVYNLASISGKRAGGIVGQNYGRNDKVLISYAYHAEGTIKGSIKAGAIAGEVAGGSISEHISDKMISNAFYSEKTKDGKEMMAVDSYGIVKSIDDLRQSQTFLDDGWDISAEGGAGTTWRIYDGQSMPLLTAFLQPKDNISIVEDDGTRPPGAYFVTPSTKVSEQLRVLRYGDTTTYGKGYDYVSDVTCVVPKNEASATEPVEETIPADTKPSADTKPFADTKPSADTKPFVDTKSPADIKSPVVVGTPPAAKAPLDTEGNLSEQEMIAAYATGKEYADEIAALQHPKQEEWGTAPAAAGNDADKLVILGSGVRLPDGMSEEELEEMLREKA